MSEIGAIMKRKKKAVEATLWVHIDAAGNFSNRKPHKTRASAVGEKTRIKCDCRIVKVRITEV